jgi:hypothetical protein
MYHHYGEMNADEYSGNNVLSSVFRRPSSDTPRSEGIGWQRTEDRGQRTEDRKNVTAEALVPLDTTLFKIPFDVPSITAR